MGGLASRSFGLQTLDEKNHDSRVAHERYEASVKRLISQRVQSYFTEGLV